MAHTTDANNPDLIPANTQQSYQISHNDLPLSCPMPNMKVWDSHPRVFLPLDADGKAHCPYCGADYSLA
ncbi:MAG: zinc-finger domain-containing protein [Xanthomonadales bacterium]|nr:zinc-finger domain-containing protein [Xanthomonadales bacterium]